MATLTTTGGAIITFNPSGIAAIADHNDTTGQAVTTVYGIGSSPLMIAETVQAFMTQLSIVKDFAQLTRPDGRPIWINGGAVSMLRAPSAGEFAPAVKTVISAGPLTQGVKEPPADAIAALNAHGASL